MPQPDSQFHLGTKRKVLMVSLLMTLRLLLLGLLLLEMSRAQVRPTLQAGVLLFGFFSILGGIAVGIMLIIGRTLVTSFEMRAIAAMHKEAITDVSPELLGDVLGDFVSEGADVAAVRQTNGRYRIEAVFARWMPD